MSVRAFESSQIPGSDAQPILIDTHRPDGAPRAVVLLAHGFKGYKDYGMFPRLAESFAGHGCIAHRFNFSHSGMTNAIETFERPDLFEEDTWNRQVEDLTALIAAIADGRLAGSDVPLILFGHSRGGVSSLLAASRLGNDGPRSIDGLISAASPATCNSMSAEQQELLLAEGAIDSPSGRTGQVLRVGKGFLEEQLHDPAAFDLHLAASRLVFPYLAVHGTDDETVPASSARSLADAHPDQPEPVLIEGGNHVFNVVNPLGADDASSEQLSELISAALSFVDVVATD